MLAGDVLSLASDGRVERRRVGAVAAALRPRARGGAVIGVQRGFALEEPDGTLTSLPELLTHDRARMNEGGCDPDGRFYCGSIANGRQPGAALYRLDPDLSVSVVLERVTISNGIDWSPDGRLAYYAETNTFRVDVFDYARDVGLTRRRPFVGPGPARPDGLTVDAEGGVWVALSNGAAVRRYTPEGVLDEVVEVPVTKVTACTFGGANLDELFITTSRAGLDPGDEPGAGALFHATVGVTGLPVREFGG